MGVRHTETNLIIWAQTSVPGNQPGAATAVAPARPVAEALFGADRLYDAGNKGCASGPMDEIAALLRKMESGQTLEILATDPTVAVDLAAWCRMTGNILVQHQDIHYLVKKK